MLRVLRHRSREIRMLAAAAVVLAIAATAVAYPRPNRVPTRWELDFQSGPLRLYSDPVTRDNYWYFTYKVVNNSGEDQYWAPRFTLFTDNGDILDSGANVPVDIERDLIRLLGNDLLERQNQVIGRIFVGEPNAIEGLVVWPAEDMSVTELSLFVSGISGETAAVANPVTGDRAVLQKTLQRDFVVPGDPAARGSRPVELLDERWIMR